MGSVAFEMGEFRKAEQFYGAAATNDSVPAWRGYVLARRSLALWNLGFPDQALALAKEVLRLGDDADDLYREKGHAAALLCAAQSHMGCGELAEAEDLFGKSLNICTERGFLWLEGWNTTLLGLMSALRGQVLAGLEQIRRGIIELGSANQALEQQPQSYGSFLALGLELAGRPDDAFAALIPDLERMEQSGVESGLAGMHHLKGRLLELKSNWKEAENSYRTSIEIARRQHAKSLELRATTSIARLLAKQGKRDEARKMLSEIYNWFTEGFDTADLKDAKTLLDELQS
jgi:tetratricopeptide (TPR) repeat protein